MREMKDSGVPWIGDIPTMIQLKKLKYLVSFEKGKLPQETNLEGNGSPYIGASEMNGSAPKVFTTSAIPMCREDDILILWDGANAGLVSTNHKGAVSSTVCRVRKQSGDDSRYLYYCLKNAERYYRDKVSGTTIPHMSTDYLDDTFILGFSLEEQRRIANFLDVKCAEIDSILEQTKASIEEYKALKQSVITEAVTKGIRGNRSMKDSGIEWIGEIPIDWEISTLGRVSNSVRNGYVGPTRDLFVEEGVRYIQSLHIKDGVIDFSRQEYYVSEDWASKRPKIRTNDLLIVQTGDIGQVALVKEEYNGCNCHALIIIGLNESLVFPLYISYYLRSHVGKELLLQTKTGALLPHLNSGKVVFTEICIPSIAEQQEIAAYLDEKCSAIDSLIASKEALIGEMEAYKKSLIYEYVTGKKEVPAI